MIKKVGSNQEHFKEVTFEPGFNVVLADRSKTSSNKDSRNGLGKTLLIEIIHFCMGASKGSWSSLDVKQLQEWVFYVDFQFDELELTASRSINDPNTIFLTGGIDEFDFMEDQIDGDTAKIDVNMWKSMLGEIGFGLSSDVQGEYAPSARALCNYFVRKGSYSYADPFKYYAQQKTGSIQVHNAYLLGLNWEYAIEFQKLRDKENNIKKLKEAIKTGLLPDYTGTIGELEAEAVNLETELDKARQQLSNFKVHPQYRDIELKSNLFTSKIHELSNNNSIDRQLLEDYKQSIEDETVDPELPITQLYEEAGVLFPDSIKKQLEELTAFQDEILKNRKAYLKGEIDRLTATISGRESEIKKLSDERAELLEVLKSHQALDEHSKIEGLVNNLDLEHKDILEKIEKLKQLENDETNLSIEKDTLLQKARSDYEDREKHIKHLIASYNANSQELYSEHGSLSIDVGRYGYQFKVDIKRANSQGVNLMKVFTYDLLLAQVGIELERDFGLLIHDSMIFDGVDERQVAKALELAYSRCTQYGFQYICTMNSDMIPSKDFSQKFLDQFNQAIRLRLSDESEETGLLGIRY